MFDIFIVCDVRLARRRPEHQRLPVEMGTIVSRRVRDHRPIGEAAGQAKLARGSIGPDRSHRYWNREGRTTLARRTGERRRQRPARGIADRLAGAF
jgi:hypothetical protein